MIIGSIIAVTIKWWVKAEMAATANMITKIALTSPFPESFVTHSPIMSVTPVWESPADKMKTAATMMAGSLEKPEKASLTSMMPVIDRARMRGDKIQDCSKKDTILEAGDNFVIRTTPDELVSFDAELGLVLKALHKFSDGKENLLTLAGEEKRILKAVISSNSFFSGKTVADIDFYNRYGVAVVGVWRKSGWISTGVADIVLRAGDMLVMWGPKEKLDRLTKHNGFLMVLPFFATSKKRSKSKLASFIMLASIVTAAAGLLPAYLAFMTGAMAMILTKCVNIEQAYESIEVKIYVMIAGVIPLGIAMEHTGVDKLLAGHLKNYTGTWEPIAMLLIFFWISALLTQILSDAATTVLLAPIAVAFAKSAHISPTAAVVCVTMGAIASFLTPIGHHGNLLILSPGGYRFNDFLKIGLPLTVILSAITCYMSVMVWH